MSSFLLQDNKAFIESRYTILTASGQTQADSSNSKTLAARMSSARCLSFAGITTWIQTGHTGSPWDVPWKINSFSTRIIIIIIIIIIIDMITIFHEKSVGIFVVPICTRYHLLESSGSLD